VVCQKSTAIVNGLDQKIKDEVKITTASASLPESDKDIKENSLGSHGVVLRDADNKVVWTFKSHGFKKEDLLEGLKKLEKSPEKE